MNELAQRLAAIRARMDAACASAGRQPEEVRLIAASKTRTAAEIEALRALGVDDFGESRMQEATAKIAELDRRALEWHFIGHLQSNKTRELARHFHWVHTLDSIRLAERLSAAARSAARPLQLLLQVNVAADPDKYGLMPKELYPAVETLMQRELPGVQLRGLMTIGFQQADEHQSRASFAALRALLEGCRQRFGEDFSELSMGMSGDFEAAILEGSTMVRVGTALFGVRDGTLG